MQIISFLCQLLCYFFSGSVRAHHQKQIIDSSSKIDSKEKKEAEEEEKGDWRIVEIVVLSLLLLIFHVPSGDEDGVRHNCGSD